MKLTVKLKMNKTELRDKAEELRKKLNQDNYSPLDPIKLTQVIENLTLVFYPLSNNISGACFKGKSSCLIAINSKMSLGRQNFSLAHELYHLYYGEPAKSTVSPLNIAKDNKTENDAETFASYFLIPQISLREMINKFRVKNKSANLTIADVIELEQYFGVSHKAMLYRLKGEDFIDEKELKDMKEMIVSTEARKLGYDTSLYFPNEANKATVLRHYIALANKLREKEKISENKYEELLLDAMRVDLVYGIDEKQTPEFE